MGGRTFVICSRKNHLATPEGTHSIASYYGRLIYVPRWVCYPSSIAHHRTKSSPVVGRLSVVILNCSRWGGKGEGGGKEKERKGREGRDREGWEGNEGKGRTKRKGREGQGRKGREYIWIRMLIMVLVLMLERTPTFHNNKSLTFSLMICFLVVRPNGLS